MSASAVRSAQHYGIDVSLVEYCHYMLYERKAPINKDDDVLVSTIGTGGVGGRLSAVVPSIYPLEWCAQMYLLSTRNIIVLLYLVKCEYMQWYICPES